MERKRKVKFAVLIALLFYRIIRFVKSDFPRGAHYGSEFVFAFPKSGQKIFSGDKGVLEIHMVSFREATVTVTVWPRLKNSTGREHNGAFHRTAMTLTPLDPGVHRLDWSLQDHGVDLLSDGVVRIEVAEAKKIAVYAMLTPARGGSDGFLVLPVDALGTRYCFAFWQQKTGPSHALVVSAHNNEELNNIYVETPKTATNDWTNPVERFSLPAGKDLEIELFANELVVLTENTNKGPYCLNSTKPVAVIVASRWATQGDKDSGRYGHMAEMIPPIDQWGNKIHVDALVERTNTKCHVLHTHEMGGSRLSLQDCNKEWKTFNELSGPTSDNPKMTLVMTGSPAVLTYMPPVEQFTNYYMFVVPESSHTFRNGTVMPYTSTLSVIIQEYKMAGLLLDGVKIEKVVHDLTIGIMPNFVILHVPVTSGAHQLYHEHSQKSFGVVVHGVTSRGDAYAFPAGLLHTKTSKWCRKRPYKSEYQGNGIDDDCDGEADEEILNFNDDDKDGKVDEDITDMLRTYIIESPSAKEMRTSRQVARSSNSNTLVIVAMMAFLGLLVVLCTVLIAVKKRALLKQHCCKKSGAEGWREMESRRRVETSIEPNKDDNKKVKTAPVVLQTNEEKPREVAPSDGMLENATIGSATTSVIATTTASKEQKTDITSKTQQESDEISYTSSVTPSDIMLSSQASSFSKFSQVSSFAK